MLPATGTCDLRVCHRMLLVVASIIIVHVNARQWRDFRIWSLATRRGQPNLWRFSFSGFGLGEPRVRLGWEIYVGSYRVDRWVNVERLVHQVRQETDRNRTQVNNHKRPRGQPVAFYCCRCRRCVCALWQGRAMCLIRNAPAPDRVTVKLLMDRPVGPGLVSRRLGTPCF